MRAQPHQRGFTLAEALTVAVVLVVLAAIAIPSYRNHLLRVRRTDARAALLALQGAQDRHFGRHARYAEAADLTRPSPAGLGLEPMSSRGFYRIELRTDADGLGYLATAGAVAQQGQDADTHCVQMSIDHDGRRRASDASGADRSEDCWK